MDEKLTNAMLNELRMQTGILTDMATMMTVQLNTQSALLSLRGDIEEKDIVLVTALSRNINVLTAQMSAKLNKETVMRKNAHEIEKEYAQKIKLLQDSRHKKLNELLIQPS